MFGGARIGGRRGRAAAAAAAAGVLAVVALWAGSAPATKVLSDQEQLTANTTGPGARDAAVAYNSKKRQWLVVYTQAVGPGETDVFAQRLSDLGNPIGDPTRVSITSGADFSARDPVVAYSRKTNSYLVAFAAEGLLTDEEVEVFGQRLNAGGGVSGSRIRISEIGPDDDPAHTVLGTPAITYNDDRNEYLVAWSANDVATDEFEIQAQRLGATGNRTGAELTLSSTPDTDRNALEPAAAYNAKAEEYLVVWQDDGFGADNEFDVFGQRVSQAGVPIGADDFRISETGLDGEMSLVATSPSVAANGVKGNYLVAFSASLVPSEELEIKIQRLSGQGDRIGDGNQRVTDVGADGVVQRSALGPAVAFNSAARQYVVTYLADDLSANDEFEVFGQRLSSAGNELGPNDLRLSDLTPDGDPDLGTAFQPLAIAANGQLSEWLIAYWGDQFADDVFNVYSRRIGLSGKCGGKTARVGGPGRDVIKLTKKRDVIAARGGKDNVRGQGGKDRICGGKGRDRLFGGKGKDRLIGGKGRDRCVGGKGRDKAKGCESTGSL